MLPSKRSSISTQVAKDSENSKTFDKNSKKKRRPKTTSQNYADEKSLKVDKDRLTKAEKLLSKYVAQNKL